jgi:hypothetical protein
MESNSSVRYRDHVFILIAVPLINLLNYYLTYSSIAFTGYFFLTYTIDTLTGFACWYGGRAAIIYFDKKMPWEANLGKRIAIQLPVVCIVILGIIVISTEFVNYLFRPGKKVPLGFYTHDLFIFLIWALFINILYAGYYFFQRYVTLQQKRDEAVKNNMLLFKTGNMERVIPVSSILCFYISNEIVYCLTQSGKIPAGGYTLDKLEDLLDKKNFFRANRQWLVTQGIVSSIKKEDYGKISINTHSQFSIDSTIPVSRLKAAAFKAWLKE